ncbi:MAG TPA: VanR-ABDEGLN family response regulator transcription factor [Firmicutes bacterium]|nr:VanR-ABDEGLN family response regulator transcription factor [Bacillota bacterium]
MCGIIAPADPLGRLQCIEEGEGTALTGEGKAPRVLVVDDEREIADLVTLYLKNEGCRVYTCCDGAEALRWIQTEELDLAILDVMLPGVNGFELCRRIRESHTYPVIMLTARVEDMDKINGLTIGADDYITKPFNPLELVARAKAQLRRYLRYGAPPDREEDFLEFSGLTINRATHGCTLYGKAVNLTPIEFDILWCLAENRGRVVSQEALFERVWGEKYLDSNNTVMVHIRRLREKLKEPPRNPKIIKTVWGVGYKIE